MRCCDLGPLVVERDGVARGVGGTRVELLLAALVLHGPAPLGADRLVDLVWAASPPPRPSAALDSLVWRLRRVLAPGVPAGGSPLVRDEHGYRLVLPAGAVDSRAATADGERVRTLATEGDPAVVDVADRALALWRGLPYDGVPDDGWLGPERTRLEDLRLELAGHRVDALVAGGHRERALADLGPLLAAHPMRESLWAARMLALYREGRQAEALGAFDGARRALDEELGLRPGPALQRLHARVLAQDPVLDAPGPRSAPGAERVRTAVGPSPGRPPHRGARLVGREDERRALLAALADDRVVTLVGPPGVGKTGLALDAVEALRGEVGEVWFADLADLTETDTARVTERVAAALGVAPGSGVDAAHALATAVEARRLLLVLDNCEQVAAAAADVVDLLLEAGPKVTVLVTSRWRLDVDGERVLTVAPLPLPAASTPDALAASPAARLVLERARVASPDRLAGGDRAAVAAVCAAVDGLPLGLELAAARSAVFTWTEIADDLRRDPAGLVRPGRGPLRRRSLRDSIAWSLEGADEAERTLHRRLGVLPGPFTTDAAEAVAAPAVADVRAALGGLVHRGLLVALGPARPGGPSRFRQLVPVRAHAAAALVGAGELTSCAAARDRWVADAVAGGVRLGREGQRAWYAWLDDRRATVVAAVDALLAAGPDRADTAARTVVALAAWSVDRLHVVEGLRWSAAAAALSGASPRAGAEAVAAAEALLAIHRQERGPRARLDEALGVLTAPGDDPVGRAETLVELAVALWIGDSWVEAAEVAEAARALGGADDHVSVLARAVRAACDVVLGDRTAAGQAREVVAVAARRGGHAVAATLAGVALLLVAAEQGDAEGALALSAQVLRGHLRSGRADVGDALEQHGMRWAAAGSPSRAVRAFAASAAHQHRLGRRWPRHPGSAEVVAALARSMPPEDHDRAWAAGTRIGRRTGAGRGVTA